VVVVDKKAHDFEGCKSWDSPETGLHIVVVVVVGAAAAAAAAVDL